MYHGERSICSVYRTHNGAQDSPDAVGKEEIPNVRQELNPGRLACGHFMDSHHVLIFLKKIASCLRVSFSGANQCVELAKGRKNDSILLWSINLFCMH